VEKDRELLERHAPFAVEAAGRAPAGQSVVQAALLLHERELDGLAAGRVEVRRRRAVPLDELRGGPLGVLRDLRLIGRQREVGVAESRREVVERRSGVPGDRGQHLVAATQLGERLVVAIEEQQPAAGELPDAAGVLHLGPLHLGDLEQQPERIYLQRARFAGQRRRDERRVADAVDEEKRRSARVRQR
jgi:hypothetical protein